MPTATAGTVNRRRSYFHYGFFTVRLLFDGMLSCKKALKNRNNFSTCIEKELQLISCDKQAEMDIMRNIREIYRKIAFEINK